MGDRLYIDGPYPGKITESALNDGYLIMIAGGTGVIPFLDIIDLCTKVTHALLVCLWIVSVHYTHELTLCCVML